MELKIYDKANNLRLTASPNTSSSVTEEIGGECSVSASFTHTEYVPLDVDDYIELESVRYKVKSRYRPKQKNTQTYEYSVKFYAEIHDAEDTLMLFQEGGTTSEFSYDGGPREHLQLWIDNMNRRAGGNLWSIGTVITADNKTIDYRNVKCWDAAFGSNGIAATFETEMWADGYVINLCKAERGEMVELGYLQGLTNLAQEDNGEVKFFTRLFPLGSTKNIDASKYGYSRLQLPDRSLYVDKNVDLYGVKEETEETAFSEIFPKYIGTISSVRTEEKTSEEGRKYTVYYFKDNGMNWNPKDYEIPDLDYMLKFQTGELAGRGTDGSFQAAWHEDTREWEIINVYPDDTTQIPGGAIIPQPGDQYIPWNFAMPQEYITEAEQEYKQAVDDYLNTYSFDPNKYTGTTDRNYIEKNHTPLRIGWNVRLLSEQYFGTTGGYKDTRVTKVQRKLNDLCQATITCSDEVGTGWKSSVDNSLNSLRYEVARQSEEKQIDVLKTSDTKTPSDYNVFSSLRSRAEFVSKKFNDTVIGVLTFLQTALFRAGAVFGKNGFASGLTGFGAKIDDNGNAEVESLTSRRFIETPEFRYNRVDVKVGDKWRAPGAGIIESVDTESKICTLKLEEGEIGAVAVGDICMGIFHSLTSSDNATEDTDDSRGNRTFAGFCTVYFTITEVIGSRNEQFKYQIRPVSERWKYSFDPFSQMNFVAYGSFTREDRQTSVYETRTYTRHLWKQNTWEIGVANIAKQSGDLSNLNVFGLNMEGYSEYTNSVYFTGTVTQIKPDGTPVITANDRGAWPPEDNHADYYDRFSYDGCLWLCVNENGTDTAPSKENPNWLLQVDKGSQGNQGESFTLLGPWYDGLVVPKLGVVTMGGSSFAAKVATSNPPMWTLKDNAGNRLKTESGYLLTGEINTAEYDILAEKGEQGQKGLDGLQGEKGEQGIPGEKGADGKTSYFHLKYSENANGNPMTETPSTYIGTYVDFEQADSDDYTKYAWARFKGLQGEKGDQGIPGYNGVDGKTYYLHIKYSNDGGNTFTSNNGEDAGDYIGQYVDTNSADSNKPSDYKWAKIKGDKGDKGDGYTQMGQWYDGMVVPKMGVVTMGGSSYVAKNATSNPPMWTLKDAQGNRLKTESGYLLTGEINTSEYDVLAEKGDQGDKGDKGDQGEKGETGETGAQGKQGLDGCVIRDSEWAIGTEYRNDSNITDGSLDVRYIDVVLVANEATETGWDAYKCLKTHVSSESITYTNTSYWEKFGANVGTIFTSLIVAKNAKIKFLSGNQLTIQKSDGTVTAGLSGSDEGEKVRFWAGSETPDNAPFRVNQYGSLYSSSATITGEIHVSSGTIGGFTVTQSAIGSTNEGDSLLLMRNGILFSNDKKTAGIGDTLPGSTGIVSKVAGVFTTTLTDGDLHSNGIGTVIIQAKGGITHTALSILTDERDYDTAIEFRGKINTHGSELGGSYGDYGLTTAVGFQHVWDPSAGRFRLGDLCFVNGILTGVRWHDN